MGDIIFREPIPHNQNSQQPPPPTNGINATNTTNATVPEQCCFLFHQFCYDKDPEQHCHANYYDIAALFTAFVAIILIFGAVWYCLRMSVPMRVWRNLTSRWRGTEGPMGGEGTELEVLNTEGERVGGGGGGEEEEQEGGGEEEEEEEEKEKKQVGAEENGAAVTSL